MKPKYVYYLNCDGFKSHAIKKACKQIIQIFKNPNETWFVIPVFGTPSRLEKLD